MTTNHQPVTIDLPPILDVQASSDLRELLKQKILAGPAILNASAVEVLTLPCMQIILSAAKAANLTICEPSAEFTKAFHDLGLDPPPAAALGPPEPSETVSPEGQPSEAPAEVLQGAKRILTIDDSKTMRDMLKLTLAGAGYDVLQGVDGQDGLDVLGDQLVDVIITDINMPRMDGYEVIRELRKKPHLDQTPILVLTTESEAEKRNIARSAGATGWMVKPFNPEKLLATVQKVIPETSMGEAK